MTPARGTVDDGTITANPQISTITFGWRDAARQFDTHLRAHLKSPDTRLSYEAAVRFAGEFFASLGLPDPYFTAVRAEHIELWRIHLLDGGASEATVVNRDKGLRAFFKWLRDEGEIKDDPMKRLKRPELVEKDPDAATPEEVRAMIATCRTRSFTDRRDAALLAFLFDTGWRSTEVLAVTVEQVQGVIVVPGKGRKEHRARLSPNTQALVDRYLRVRGFSRPELWLTRTGRAMNRHDVWEVVSYRSDHAGIRHLKPHALRHGHADAWLRAGGNLMDLKENMGHSSVRVTERYLRALGRERAMEARERFSPGHLLGE